MRITSIVLSIIWLIFTVLFFSLGISHWKLAGPRTMIMSSKMPPVLQEKLREHKLYELLMEFIHRPRIFINLRQRFLRKRAKNAAYGCFLASGTALFSLILQLIQLKREKVK